jgi:hypothetical protein
VYLWLGGALAVVGGVEPNAVAFGGPSPEEAHSIAVEAYVYGYPLVTMEMTRRVMTNVQSDDGRRAPMGQLARMRTVPAAVHHDVTAPDASALSTTAWVDVSREPYVLSLPDMQGRYFLFPMFDAWTNVFQDPGTRTTGTGPQKFVITGPRWKGENLPPGAAHVVAPTGLVWIVGRIFTRGPGDLDAVHALEDQVSLLPLRVLDRTPEGTGPATRGQPYVPPAGSVDPSIDTNTPVRAQVDALDTVSFFRTMTGLMADNPPQKDDKSAARPGEGLGRNDNEILARMAKIGLEPGKPFEPSKLSPQILAAIEHVPEEARERLKAEARSAPMKENGWRVLPRTGTYGTEYPLRALVAAVGLGANLSEDVVYPVAVEDEAGQPLDGAKRYILHFDKDMPPVRGAWSLTMYDDQMRLVDNPLHRYALPARPEGRGITGQSGQQSQLSKNRDGSVNLLVQPDSPGPDRESNWLPSRPGRFVLMLRLYWPAERPPTILDGTWKPPLVHRAP